MVFLSADRKIVTERVPNRTIPKNQLITYELKTTIPVPCSFSASKRPVFHSHRDLNANCQCLTPRVVLELMHTPACIAGRLKATRLNAFTPSSLFNATAVQYRTSKNQHKLILSHSPGGGTTLQTPFSRYRLVKVSGKSVQPFPRTVVWYFVANGKKRKKKQKNICKTYTHPLIGGCVNKG